jgi:dTDP-4-dehydrorhamnose 3,5-epimerase
VVPIVPFNVYLTTGILLSQFEKIMKFYPTNIPEIIIVEPQVYGDDRGFNMETYQLKNFTQAGIETAFVQDNHSGSKQGIIRGIHYQIQQAQGKLVRVVVGEIFDVAVDLRKSSPTFMKWTGLRLSAQNKRQIWVPKGFGHGFYVLSEWAEVIYKVTDFYAPQWERTLAWNDPSVGIDWPLIENQPPLLSAKDSQGRFINELELFD